MGEKPNILFLFPDQWRGDCLSYLGHPVVETPFLDQLCHEGVTFTSAYSPSPICIPARASLFTGMSPSNSGRLGYVDKVPWKYETTLMKELRDGGYQTLMAGKTHFYPQRAALGFEEMRLYDTQQHDRGFVSDYHAWLERAGGGQVRDTAQGLSTSSWVVAPWTQPEHFHPNTWTTDAALELLGRRDPTRPFFLWVGYHRPHPPHDPPYAYYERFLPKELPQVPVGGWSSDEVMRTIDAPQGCLSQELLDRTRRAYYAQIAHVDYQIGRLLHRLRQTGEIHNTWIVFSSDHGEQLGDHHLFRKSTPLEGSAKIPLIVRAPRTAANRRGAICQTAVNLTDLMPTLLEAAGIAIPASVDGHSLLPCVADSRQALSRGYIHGECAGAEGWQYVTDGKSKFFWESVSGREWFFDLERDPQELHNLAGVSQHLDRVALWRGRLIETLARRPEDGLVQDGRLVAGRALPRLRDKLLDSFR